MTLNIMNISIHLPDRLTKYNRGKCNTVFESVTINKRTNQYDFMTI